MKPRPDSPERNPEDGRDLRQRQAVVVVKDDDDTVIRSQILEGPLELVSKIGIGEGIRTGRDPVVDPHLADPGPASSTRLEETEAHHESVGPCLEAPRVAQARQFPPHRDERLLDRLVCKIGVANDPVRRHIEARRGPSRQVLVGFALASLRSNDQILIHG